MTRCRNLIVGLLLIHSAIAQYESNIFLNGYKNDLSSFATDQQKSAPMDLSKNLFLSHMISSRAAQFQAPQYLPPKEQLTCVGPEVCVSAGQCQGGYFAQNFGASRKNCDIETEVCCLYRPPPTPPKPTPVPSTPCLDRNYDCISPSQCANGEINIKGYSQPKSAERCYAPEVCCRIPPPETTVLTDDGYVVRVPENPLIATRRPTPATDSLSEPIYTTPRPIPTFRTTTSREYLPPFDESESVTKTYTVARPNPTTPRPKPNESDLSQPIFPNKPSQPAQPTRSPFQTTRSPFQPTRSPFQPQPNQNQNLPQQLPSACAAALICTDIQFCNSTGFISKSPVNLSPDQEAYRVPLSDCRDSSKGLIGKCCRDPDYVDPWPVSQLGQYNAELFGEKKVVRRQNAPFGQQQAQVRAPVAQLGCATRNFNTVLKGLSPIDAAFAEYPWQVMVLLESTKSLLCGGALIADDVVLTSARCVQGHKPFDVLIKAGEWKLGRDEEPLDFQIKRAKTIAIHPKFDTNTLAYDLAILHLDSKLKLAEHIAPICVDESIPDVNDECITTGWGKLALNVHLQDAVMHHSKVTPVSDAECYPTEHSICARSKIDGCELDFGSALACTNSRGSYVLKGIYTAEDKCGESAITFAQPDVQWIAATKSRLASLLG